MPLVPPAFCARQNTNASHSALLQRYGESCGGTRRREACFSLSRQHRACCLNMCRGKDGAAARMMDYRIYGRSPSLPGCVHIAIAKERDAHASAPCRARKFRSPADSYSLTIPNRSRKFPPSARIYEGLSSYSCRAPRVRRFPERNLYGAAAAVVLRALTACSEATPSGFNILSRSSLTRWNTLSQSNSLGWR